MNIGLVHEAGHSIYNMESKWYLLKEMNVDILIFGSLNYPYIEKYDNKYLLCPGSISNPKFSKSSFMEIIIENQSLKQVNIIELDNEKCCKLFKQGEYI